VLNGFDPRRAPRSQRFREEKVRGLIFDFSDDEMRLMRAAAASSDLTVTDYLRHLLKQQDWNPQAGRPATACSAHGSTFFISECPRYRGIGDQVNPRPRARGRGFRNGGI
jgi:hypothetical protein